MAFKALAMIPKLSGGARQVAGALLDRFNRRTKQCDPSIETLMAETGLAKSTVNDALDDLCDDPRDGDTGKLFGRVPHGGFSHRTSYHPRWQAFARAIDEHAKRKDDASKVRKTGRSRAPETVRKAAPSTAGLGDAETVRFSEPSRSGFPDFDSPENRTQTRISNPLKKPVSVAPALSGGAENAVEGLSTEAQGPAWQAAHRRLSQHVNERLDRDRKERVWQLSESAWDRATTAELRQQGSGFEVLLAQMGGQP